MAETPHPPPDDQVALLRGRLEAGAIVAGLSIGCFALVDMLWGTPTWNLTLLRTAQVTFAGGTWLLARHVRTWPAVANGTLAFIALLMVTAVLTAVDRGETDSVPVLVTMIVLITATFAGWGLRRQIVLSVLAFAGLVANMAALGQLEAAMPYPFLPITVALGVSGWIAAETERQAQARHRAESALRDSERRFRTLADHAPVPIWMTDARGALTYLNDAWGPLVSATTSRDRAFWDAVHSEDRTRLAAAAHAARASGTPYEAECRIVAPDGYTRHLAVTGIPRFSPEGRYDGHIGTAVDVTETKAETRSLAAAHRAAVEAGRLKSTFLATMSHEIRTPMHGIFGMTELALDTNDEDERREFIQRARSCAKTLMTLLDEILDLSRIEAGRVHLVRESVDLAEILRNAVDTVAMAATQKGLDIFMDIAPDVPTTIGSDPNRLRQILTNLLANAVKFTDDGEVAIGASIRDGALSFTVRDTGIGIAPESLDHIFDSFTQVHRDGGNRYGGAGLGLAISQRLAQALGGDIHVHSELGTGTTFEVTHPLSAPVGPPHAARFAGLRGAHLLVADANDSRRRHLARALEAYGCLVDELRSTDPIHDGFASSVAGPPLAAIADADTLVANGAISELRVRATGASTVLVLSCALRPGSRASIAPGDLVLTRPFLATDLLEMLTQARASFASTGS